MPLAFLAVCNPAYAMMPYRLRRPTIPIRPSSSPMIVRMKSVWASGT